MRLARLLSLINLQGLSDYALSTVNSTATAVAIAAAALVVVSIGLIYFTNTELSARARMKSETGGSPAGAASAIGVDRRMEIAGSRPVEQVDQSRLSQLQAELANLQRSEQEKGSELAKLRRAEQEKGAELANLRRSEQEKGSQLSQLETQLAEARHSAEAKDARAGELEAELARLRRAKDASTGRISELEQKLTAAQRSADEAQTLAKQIEVKQGPRAITPEQRTQFLAAIQGLPTGKIIVSAFFDNQETHHFGAELLSLLKKAGFQVLERAPVNFFSTARPSGGIRIGCRDVDHAPPHFETVRKGLQAIGFDPPNTSMVNADEPDVVEIQITPRQ
jgi:hypothetical protein